MAGMLMKIACVVVACMVVFAPHAKAAISCGQVAGKLLPCLGYLRAGGAVPGNCCSGVKALNAAAQTPADKRAACGCLKSSYNSFPGIKPSNAASLPGSCGVRIPYKISPNTDCSKIQ